MNPGYIVCAILVVMLWQYWGKMRGRSSLEDLLHQSARHHQRVAEIHRKFPNGGTSRLFERRLDAEQRQYEPALQDFPGIEA